MVESFKLFVRTYVYWVGLIFGFAIVPGSLLFTGGVAPVNTPSWLTPLAGLLLFIIDRPSTWETPLWRALLIRVLGAGFAATMLIAFDAVASTYYGSQHWSETLLSLSLGWIAFTVMAGRMLMRSSARFATPTFTNRDAIRTYTTWIGICFGIFYIPATGLAAAGTLLMVLPLYGTFLTGLVLLIVDPPQRWPQPRVKALWIRLSSSGAAALLLTVTNSFYRSTDTHEIFVGDWRGNLLFFVGAWALYAAVAGAAYLMRGPSHEASDNSVDEFS